MSLVKTSPAVLIERRSHRFVDHVDLAAPGVLRRIAHGTNLHVGRTRRDADHHSQRRGEEAARGFDFLDHAPQHQLRGVEIGDHAVLQRTDRFDVRIGFLVHLPRLLADGDQFSRVNVQGDDRGFVHDDLAVINYQRVGRTEVDGQLLCQ